MPSSTLRNAYHEVDARRAPPLDLTAIGWALTITLVGLFILCYLAMFVRPSLGLAHGWIALFSSQPDNLGRTFVEGVIGSVTGAWISAILFVPVYNRLIRR